jgi:hypothetical protein
MSDSFTLLTPGVLAAGGKSSTASPAPSAPVSGTFQPLAGAGGKTSAAPGACAAKPSVILLRNGNTVTSIRVQCTCGQVIELNCQY